ncbi:MAG: hypothetical protein HYU41_09260 [Candidatus Rokubacteria bacterium]|nr:hypothetical protein [Candidatus Rokubacteria bacterium]
MSAHHERSDRFVTARGLRFHYCESGEAAAPAVVFLHRITSDARVSASLNGMPGTGL